MLLFSGIFLTVAYAFLQVTDEERTLRAIAKIYGEQKKITAVEITADVEKQGQAAIIEAYKVEDGNYLVKSKGKGGFGGTVTCWVRVDIENGAIAKVNKVVIEKSDGETQLNQIDFLSKYFDTPYSDGLIYGKDNGFITSGSSMSSAAINNAVNGAVSFVKIVGLGAKVEKPEDPYKDYAFHDYIDMAKTEWDRKGDDITFKIVTIANSPADSFKINVTVGADKKISAFLITVNGSTEDGEGGNFASYMKPEILSGTLFVGKGIEDLKAAFSSGETFPAENAEISTGATKSNFLCVSAAAFATANYEYVKNLVLYKDLIDMDATDWEVEGDSVKYTIVTKDNSPANPFTINVTVGADKKISAFSITVNGSTEGFEDNMKPEILSGALFVGKSLDDLKATFSFEKAFPTEDSTEIQTGATKSNMLCLSAAAFATANYDYCLNTPKGGK